MLDPTTASTTTSTTVAIVPTSPVVGDPLLLPTVGSISGNLEHTLLFSEFYCTGGRYVAVTETYHVTIWGRLSQTRINVGT